MAVTEFLSVSRAMPRILLVTVCRVAFGKFCELNGAVDFMACDPIRGICDQSAYLLDRTLG